MQNFVAHFEAVFEGNKIKRLYTAPLGDPIAFDINGYILALRKEEAKLIEITLKKIES